MYERAVLPAMKDELGVEKSDILRVTNGDPETAACMVVVPNCCFMTEVCLKITRRAPGIDPAKDPQLVGGFTFTLPPNSPQLLAHLKKNGKSFIPWWRFMNQMEGGVKRFRMCKHATGGSHLTDSEALQNVILLADRLCERRLQTSASRCPSWLMAKTCWLMVSSMQNLNGQNLRESSGAAMGSRNARLKWRRLRIANRTVQEPLPQCRVTTGRLAKGLMARGVNAANATNITT